MALSALFVKLLGILGKRVAAVTGDCVADAGSGAGAGPGVGAS